MDETTIPSEKPKFKLPDNLIGNIFTGSIRDDLVVVPSISKRIRVSLEGKVGSRVDSTKYGKNGHWDFDEELGMKGFVGFIYVIVDKNNNKIYLGKKQFKGAGKLNKGQESNWRWYISSSKELSAAIKNYGKEGFEFIAIEQYRTKGMVSYAEVWSLMFVESPYRQDKWYNLLVNKVSWTVKEPISERHKRRLVTAMRMVDADKPILEYTSL